MTDKPPSQWRGGAGGAPILSQPIADWRRYPLGKPGTSRWWGKIAAAPILLVLLPVAWVLEIMTRPSKWEYRLPEDGEKK